MTKTTYCRGGGYAPLRIPPHDSRFADTQKDADRRTRTDGRGRADADGRTRTDGRGRTDADGRGRMDGADGRVRPSKIDSGRLPVKKKLAPDGRPSKNRKRHFLANRADRPGIYSNRHPIRKNAATIGLIRQKWVRRRWTTKSKKCNYQFFGELSRSSRDSF